MNEGYSRSGTPVCRNLNHVRSNVTVGHCPQCGAVVNASARVTRCNEARHALARRQQFAFCMDCGVPLKPGQPPTFRR